MASWLVIKCQWGTHRFEVRLLLSETVQDLKERIQDTTGLPPDHQKLLFAGRAKNPMDNECLQSLGLLQQHKLLILGRTPSVAIEGASGDEWVAGSAPTRRLPLRTNPMGVRAISSSAPELRSPESHWRSEIVLGKPSVTVHCEDLVRVSWKRPRTPGITVMQYELFVDDDASPIYSGIRTSVFLKQSVSNLHLYRVSALTTAGETGKSPQTSVSSCKVTCCVCFDTLPASEAVFCPTFAAVSQPNPSAVCFVELPANVPLGHSMDVVCFMEYARSRLHLGELRVPCPEKECRARWRPASLRLLLDANARAVFDYNEKNAVEQAFSDRVECRACGYWEVADEEALEQLDYLFVCSGCGKLWCMRCEPPFPFEAPSLEGHVCRSNRPTLVAELLTHASTMTCPAEGCSALAVPDDTNLCYVYKCRDCETFFCFLCGKSLGKLGEDAHNAFPHTNEETGEECVLFDVDAWDRVKKGRIQRDVGAYLQSMRPPERKRTLSDSDLTDFLSDHGMVLSDSGDSVQILLDEDNDEAPCEPAPRAPRPRRDSGPCAVS